MAINFTPDLKPYSGQGKFRYWVQMVLPTIYDDSLSYMELLNKVVYALNLVVEDNETVEDNVKALLDAFNELQLYVNSKLGDDSLEEYVDKWLDEHPEATTTVMDGAITMRKFANDVLAKFREEESIFFYFPSLENGAYSGSSAMMVVNDKCVLFDCQLESNWDAIYPYYQNLYDSGKFSNIDYIIISHYHRDHIDNLRKFLTYFPHENCITYLPLDPTGYYNNPVDLEHIIINRQNTINTLTEFNIEFIEVNSDTTITIEENIVNITLFNTTPGDYSYYSTIDSVYNNYSMCALIKTGNTFSLFPGDIQKEAQERITTTRILPRLFLYAAHHHAIQNDDYKPYLDKIYPKYCVVSTNEVRGLISAAGSFIGGYFDNVCSTAYSSFTFVTDKDSGEIVYGRHIEEIGYHNTYIDYYVDNTYEGNYIDGSEEHPFKDIKDKNNLYYRIYVKGSETPYNKLYLRNLNRSIELIGVKNENNISPVLDGGYFRDSALIQVNDIIFKGEGHTNFGSNKICFVEASSIVFLNCTFIGKDNHTQNGLQLYLGKAYLTNCLFENFDNSISSYRYGEATTNGIIANNCYNLYNTGSIGLTIRGEDTITDTNNYMRGNVNTACPVIMTNKPNTSNIRNLVATNTTSVTSNPFYLQGVGYCFIAGNVIKKINTEDIT